MSVWHDLARSLPIPIPSMRRIAEGLVPSPQYIVGIYIFFSFHSVFDFAVGCMFIHTIS
jgi:hypothetical protein